MLFKFSLTSCQLLLLLHLFHLHRPLFLQLSLGIFQLFLSLIVVVYGFLAHFLQSGILLTFEAKLSHLVLVGFLHGRFPVHNVQFGNLGVHVLVVGMGAH